MRQLWHQTFAALAVLLVVVPRGAAGQTLPAAVHDPHLLASAFAGGAGGVGPALVLETQTDGANLRLLAHSSAKAKVVVLDCALCSPFEGLAAARALGAETRATTQRDGATRAAAVAITPGTNAPVDAATELTVQNLTSRDFRPAIAVGGLGAAIAAAGAVLLRFHNSCAQESPKDNRCSDQHKLLAPGIALVATGAATELLLIWLLQPKRPAQPVHEGSQ